MNPQAVQTAAGLTAYLKKKKQIDLLPEIIEVLKDLAGNQRSVTRIESAVNMTDRAKQEIEQILQQKWEVNGNIEYAVNPELLGGVRITSGDRVIDLSVKGRIERIYEQV